MSRTDVFAADVFGLVGGVSMTCHPNVKPSDGAPPVRVAMDGLRRAR